MRERVWVFRDAVASPPHHSSASRVQRRLQVGAADDAYEQEADAVADRVVSMLQRSPSPAAGQADGAIPPAPARPDGAARRAGGFDGETRSRMEHAFGADFSGVRIRRSATIDLAAEGLQADAFTVGRDVFVRRSLYRPGTPDGDRLLAHELTHTLQQGASRIRRSTTGFDTRGDTPTDRVEHGASRIRRSTADLRVSSGMAADRVSLKKRMMHLDFVKMKRIDPRYSKAIKETLGMNVEERPGGTWGHWWTEVGTRDAGTGEFHNRTSYGWWPSKRMHNPVELVAGVPGELNDGGDQDPHAGKPADVEFHPVMSVDPDVEEYEDVRDRVTSAIDSFARSYKGRWNWAFGWGKNCHTFQQALKTSTKLHFQKAPEWLTDPTPYLRNPHPGPPTEVPVIPPIELNCGATLSSAAITEIKASKSVAKHLTLEQLTFYAYAQQGSAADIDKLSEKLEMARELVGEMIFTAFQAVA